MEARRHLPIHTGFQLRKPRAHQVVWFVVALVGTLAALRWVGAIAGNAGRGLDASDEAYYLLSAEHPHEATASASGFDSYLAILWRICGRSIAWFRVAGLAILLVSIGLAALLCARAATSNRRRSIVLAVCIGACLAPLALTTYILWITTPSYNLVVIVVTLLVAALTARLALGSPADFDEATSKDRTQLAMAGLGFLLSVGLIAKGPAFVVIGGLSAGALVLTRGTRWLLRQWKGVGLGFGGGLVLFIVMTGLPLGIARRFARGVNANRLLRSHTSESLWELTSMRHVYGPWFLRFLIGAGALLLAWLWIRSDLTRLIITAVGAVVTATVLSRSLPGGGSAAVAGPAGWWWIRLTVMMMFWENYR